MSKGVGREARLKATVATLRALDGFVAAVARLDGVPVSALRGNPALRAAFARIGAASPAPPRVVPVRTGRRTTGYAVPSDRDVRSLAAANLAQRGVPATLDGPFTRVPARLCGLRLRSEIRWDPDPALHELAERAVRSVHAAFACRFVEGGPGDAWSAALVIPRLCDRWACGDEFLDAFGDPPAGGAATASTVPGGPPGALTYREVSCIALLRGETLRAEILVDIGDVPWDLDRDAGDALLRPAVSAGVAKRLADGFSPALPAIDSGFDGRALRMVGLCGLGDMPKALADRIAHPIACHLLRFEVLAIARFRAALPEPVRSVAGLCRGSFHVPANVASFLAARRGHGPEDHRRIREMFVLMGCLRAHSSDAGLIEAIRAGAKPEAALAALVKAPVLPRTAKALSGPFLHHGKLADPNGNTLGILTRTLDAYYGADPHRPVLDAAGQLFLARLVERIYDTALGLPTLPGECMAAILHAHRDARGRFAPYLPGIADVVGWVRERCALAFGDPRANWEQRHSRQAVAIVFPPHRRHAGLAKLDARWHGAVGALMAEHDALVEELQVAAGRTAGPAERFPHVAEGPVEIGGVSIAPLVGHAAIAEEGAALRHCIATYAARAADGECMLVSLSSPEGRSSAQVIAVETRDAPFDESWDRPRGGFEPPVAAVAPRGPGRQALPALSIVQHTSTRNAPPPPSHEAALEAWLGRIPASAIARAAEHRRRAATRAGSPYKGLDAASMGLIAAQAYGHLTRFMSGELRGKDRAYWDSL